MKMNKKTIKWYKVLSDKKLLQEGRVMTVTAGHKQLALTHFKGKFCALENKCPHQGGPLGEGTIEKGFLRCPWHGWDFHPCSGKPPGGYDDGIDTFEVKEKADGIYVKIEEEAPHKNTVADIMIQTMINWGVNTVFGMVGHSNLGLADAMRRQEEKKKLKYIGIRHEGAGAFAASAYAKLTGRPAACFGIAGPGSTNMFTGMWDAKVDRVPLLALTGQVDTQVVGTGAFQEVDLKEAFSSVAKFNQRVHKDSKHAELMNLAIKHALIDRDVSHLTFPDEVQEMVVEDEVASSPVGRITSTKVIPTDDSVTHAISLIKKSRRPIIIIGHGARNSMKEIISFAKKLKAPILTTFKAKGLIPDNHELAAGVLGKSGTPIASWFMNESDLMCVFGASFANHTGITDKKPTVQVDLDPLVLAKFHKIEAPVLGDIGLTVELFNKNLAGIKTVNQIPEIKERWDIWRKEKAKRLKEDRKKGISSIAVFDALNKRVPKNAVIALDVGNNTYSFGRYFECSGQSILMSGYLGSIGFGYPAAIGAWTAAPNRPIIAITGDGGFGQYMAEITTAVKYNMPIKHVLLNNCELAKISKEQLSNGMDVYQTDLVNPDFAEYAKNCGALGIRVTKKEDLDDALKKLFAHDGPGMVEIITDPLLI